MVRQPNVAARPLPIRTCVGCRERAAKRELLRIVAVDAGQGLELVPDETARAPGRGAHLHPRPECLRLALRRRVFARALRVEGRLDSSAVEALVTGLEHDQQSK